MARAYNTLSFVGACVRMCLGVCELQEKIPSRRDTSIMVYDDGGEPVSSGRIRLSRRDRRRRVRQRRRRARVGAQGPIE